MNMSLWLETVPGSYASCVDQQTLIACFFWGYSWDVLCWVTGLIFCPHRFTSSWFPDILSCDLNLFWFLDNFLPSVSFLFWFTKAIIYSLVLRKTFHRLEENIATDTTKDLFLGLWRILGNWRKKSLYKIRKGPVDMKISLVIRKMTQKHRGDSPSHLLIGRSVKSDTWPICGYVDISIITSSSTSRQIPWRGLAQCVRSYRNRWNIWK